MTERRRRIHILHRSNNTPVLYGVGTNCFINDQKSCHLPLACRVKNGVSAFICRRTHLLWLFTIGSCITIYENVTFGVERIRVLKEEFRGARNSFLFFPTF